MEQFVRYRNHVSRWVEVPFYAFWWSCYQEVHSQVWSIFELVAMEWYIIFKQKGEANITKLPSVDCVKSIAPLAQVGATHSLLVIRDVCRESIYTFGIYRKVMLRL